MRQVHCIYGTRLFFFIGFWMEMDSETYWHNEILFSFTILIPKQKFFHLKLLEKFLIKKIDKISEIGKYFWVYAFLINKFRHEILQDNHRWVDPFLAFLHKSNSTRFHTEIMWKSIHSVHFTEHKKIFLTR